MVRRPGAAIGDLFLDWQPPQVAAALDPELVRASSLRSRISKAVGVALKASGKSREAIAEAMSAKLGSPVTATMLDAYASEAKGGHQITLERFVVLIEATGCTDMLDFVCRPFGFIAMPERYASIVTLHQIDEHIAEMESQRAMIAARTRGPAR